MELPAYISDDIIAYLELARYALQKPDILEEMDLSDAEAGRLGQNLHEFLSDESAS